MQIVTLSPIYTPLNLKAGIDPTTALYDEVLKAIPSHNEAIIAPNRDWEKPQDSYADTASDGYEMRVLLWTCRDEQTGASLTYHVYPNETSMAQVTLDIDSALTAEAIDADALDKACQRISREVITRHSAQLYKVLKGIMTALPSRFVDPVRPVLEIEATDVSWVSRTLLLTPEERYDPQVQALLASWLKNTTRPEDAAAIVAGSIDYSMTWLNYVIVDENPGRTRMLISAMRIAQFFYAAQQRLNEKGQEAISNTMFIKKRREIERVLTDVQSNMRLLRIEYDVHKLHLNRTKRKVIDEIMEGWDFDDLMTNGDRILNFASDRLTAIANRRAQSSSFVTELILFGIGLVAIFEVILYFIEYSREVATRPILEFDRPSLFFRMFASADADLLILFGFLLCVILVFIYARYSRNK
ncbi:hypothetical protein [Aquisalinus flavus]|uniref:Uncharacterized protein n=1 Tax=Aquisalinus flavus TaxID=1526572 RepID=A0A8J2V4K5_9PROT|nr:hypothetical protein [Aquisalinus flavus]MBD0427631.1 hypothetical protein [Aquisalinus flavus]UNE47418.1 hypothetical protein FF099_04750 [Aquisalinus flavus]GGD02539.1 hypothetical protein GCM10011342_09450 [Aquisalinus flavus]